MPSLSMFEDEVLALVEINQFRDYNCYSILYDISGATNLSEIENKHGVMVNPFSVTLSNGDTIRAKDLPTSLNMLTKHHVEAYKLDKRYRRRHGVNLTKNEHIKGLLTLLNVGTVENRGHPTRDKGGVLSGSLAWVHTKSHNGLQDKLHYHILHWSKRNHRQVHGLNGMIITGKAKVGRGTRTSRQLNNLKAVVRMMYHMNQQDSDCKVKYFIGATNKYLLRLYDDAHRILFGHGDKQSIEILRNKFGDADTTDDCLDSGSTHDIPNDSTTPQQPTVIIKHRDRDVICKDVDVQTVDIDNDSNVVMNVSVVGEKCDDNKDVSISANDDDQMSDISSNDSVLSESVSRNDKVKALFDKENTNKRVSLYSESDRVKNEQTEMFMAWLASKYITTGDGLIEFYTSVKTSPGDKIVANRILSKPVHIKTMLLQGAGALIDKGNEIFRPIPMIVGVSRKDVNEAWRQADDVWKRLLISLIAMIRHYNDHKQGYMWVYGSANMGKTTVLRTYLCKILLSYTLNPLSVGNFFFGEYAQPARLVILDDVNIELDNSNMTIVKNVLGRERSLVNPKYAGVSESRGQPSLFLQNVSGFSFCSKLKDRKIHENALKARRYCKVKICNKYFPDERAFLAMMLALDKYVVERFNANANEFKCSKTFALPQSLEMYCAQDDVEMDIGDRHIDDPVTL